MHLSNLFSFRYLAAQNQMHQETGRNRLKILVITFAVVGLWLSLYKFFIGGMMYLNHFPDIKEWVVTYMFAIFFLSLLVMLFISNAIISYSSLYRSAEASMLVTMPLEPGQIFLYKISESILFSSWAFFFLGTPLLAAYGVNSSAGLAYYLWIILLIPAFILLPAMLGGGGTILLGRFLPRRRRELLLLLLLVILVITVVMVTNLAKLRGTALPFTALWMQSFMDKLTFAQNPVLPSYWLTRALMGSVVGQHSEAVFFFLMLMANGLFAGLIAYWLAGRYYFRAYSLVQSSRRDLKYPQTGLVDWVGAVLFGLFSRPMRMINTKDLKTFVRDPVQWSQFLVFFGILAVYFLNLRNISYINLNSSFWKYLVSFLNLIATVLTLATFTTRFIYPQLSLEGQRFWILGMMPITRPQIFFGKFLFAAVCSVIIAEPLIFISAWMLHVHTPVMLYQLYIVLVICVGLAAISTAMGTIYPNFREDNPSKIVAGFGGTFNLVLSLIYTLVMIAIAIVPCHLRYAGRHISDTLFHRMIYYDTAIITVICAVVVVICLSLGVKAIKKLEI
ncbi:MAG: hypothetical protein V1701_03195 [Planctomycetota bacterium]